MEELERVPMRKEFVVNGERVTKTVALLNFTAFNRNGKTTIEKDYTSNCVTMFDYDELGNCVHTKNSLGIEVWSEFDASGNEIHTKTSYDEEMWYEYDNNDNCIYTKDSRGFEGEYRYNEKNQKYYEYGSRFGLVILHQYDKRGNRIRDMDSNGSVTRYEYDQNGKLVAKIISYGSLYYYEYDSKGNMTYMAELNTDDEVDVENPEVNFDIIEKEEYYFEYEFYPNGKVQKKYVYENYKEE